MVYMANNWEILELLSETDPSNSCKQNQTIIERIGINEISYNDFYWNYLKSNWPLVLTNASNNWECHQQWLCNNDNQPTKGTAVDFNYLKRKIGRRQVPVVNCNKRCEYLNVHSRCQMDFYDFLNYWQTRVEHCEPLRSINKEENFNDIERSADVLYLKDWHLRAEMPDYHFYRVPKHFSNDWLNEHLITTEQDDYRFVYMGPKGSWTPFHADVFGSYSWSINVLGCKKWLLLPPKEELKLKDQLNNFPYHINEALLEQHNVRYFTIYQSPSEGIFVPSGWYHQVWNTTDTISINHNWFNACNVMPIWFNLSTAMEQVIKEIEHCRQMDNFDEHCQTMLRATFGLNYLDFIQLLETIVTHRLDCHKNVNYTCNMDDSLIPTIGAARKISSKFFTYCGRYVLNDYHICHDLKAVKEVVGLMLKDSVICKKQSLYFRCSVLQENATNT